MGHNRWNRRISGTCSAFARNWTSGGQRLARTAHRCVFPLLTHASVLLQSLLHRAVRRRIPMRTLYERAPVQIRPPPCCAQARHRELPLPFGTRFADASSIGSARPRIYACA